MDLMSFNTCPSNILFEDNLNLFNIPNIDKKGTLNQ